MQPELVSRGLALRSVDEKSRSVDFVASTDAIDSYDEVVEQDWILDRYRSNPIVLFGHNSRELPIGKATRCEVVAANGRRQLECTIQFLSARANPRAEEVWQSIVEGGLRAVSVGFRPKEARFETRNGVEVFVLSQCDLHEISVVPIPANQEALAKMKQKARGASVIPSALGETLVATARAVADATGAVGTLTPGSTSVYGKNGSSMRLDANGDIHIRASGASQEDNMTEKEIAERIAKAEAEKNLVEKQIEDEKKAHAATRTALTASEGTVKSLTEDRDGWKERAEKAEAAEIANEVDKLVGFKITPAEKDTFIELRKSNPKLFIKMVADRPELKLLKGAVVGEAKTAPKSVINGSVDNGEDLTTQLFGS